MSTYSEFYVLPVKKAGLHDYRRFAEDSAKVWRKHGTMAVREYVAEDA